MPQSLDEMVIGLAQRQGSTYYGKYRGIVSDIDDPDGGCRIRALVPAVLGDQPCGWALPCAPFAGDGHGMVMLPVVGAGVWIEFEAGSLDNPIWSGGWWASGQRPQPQGPRTRVIVSENGHKLVMDDDSDEITIEHGMGPKLVITGQDVTVTVGPCELKISQTDISLNNGLIKVGLAGVGLVNGAMSFGVPP